jgi:hypothetical protein
MGVARLSDRHLSDLSESNLYSSHSVTDEDGTLVYVHTPARREDNGSICLRRGMRGCIRQINGLLYATWE